MELKHSLIMMTDILPNAGDVDVNAEASKLDHYNLFCDGLQKTVECVDEIFIFNATST